MNISDAVTYSPLPSMSPQEAIVLQAMAATLPSLPTAEAPQRIVTMVTLVNMVKALALTMANEGNIAEDMGCMLVVLATYAKAAGFDLNQAAIDVDSELKAGTN